MSSYKAIYGPYPRSHAPFVKSDFYKIFGAGFDSRCIGSEQNPTAHARMKKLLTPAFSVKALSEQEEIVQGCIDGLVAKLATLGAPEEGLDMTAWYEMIAFDILGEMAFGESFHCVEEERPHFWQQLIAKHLFFITVVDNLRRYPFLRWLGKTLLPHLTVKVQNKHSGYSRQKIANRLASKSDRKDILSELTGLARQGQISREELTAHASTLVVAGGETVAAFMAATTFYLCRNPATLGKLTTEIRREFDSSGAISSARSLRLPYLQAVINEGLRIYPPSPQGLPRVSPGAHIDDMWVPRGTETYTSVWTVSHSPKYFADPYEFKPERWLQRPNGDIKEASQPFSTGPRACIGRNFAYMEMSLLLAKIFFNFDVQLVDDSLDFEGQSHMHVQWWKPEMRVRLHQTAPEKAKIGS
ncbi:hypothetical protein MMC34_008157 [Xylographa carneopallida]|nr:hypothetical protein [Xylographa carneopallida]